MDLEVTVSEDGESVSMTREKFEDFLRYRENYFMLLGAVATHDWSTAKIFDFTDTLGNVPRDPNSLSSRTRDR